MVGSCATCSKARNGVDGGRRRPLNPARGANCSSTIWRIARRCTCSATFLLPRNDVASTSPIVSPSRSLPGAALFHGMLPIVSGSPLSWANAYLEPIWRTYFHADTAAIPQRRLLQPQPAIPSLQHPWRACPQFATLPCAWPYAWPDTCPRIAVV